MVSIKIQLILIFVLISANLKLWGVLSQGSQLKEAGLTFYNLTFIWRNGTKPIHFKPCCMFWRLLLYENLSLQMCVFVTELPKQDFQSYLGKLYVWIMSLFVIYLCLKGVLSEGKWLCTVSSGDLSHDELVSDSLQKILVSYSLVCISSRGVPNMWWVASSVKFVTVAPRTFQTERLSLILIP